MTYYIKIERIENGYMFTMHKRGIKTRIYQMWADKRAGLIYAEATLPAGAKLKVTDKTV